MPPASTIGVIAIATLAKSKLNTLAEVVITPMASDPNTCVRIKLEINTEFLRASDTINRRVSENVNRLGFETKDWE